MILLTGGYGLQAPQWNVPASAPPGYSRVYYLLSGDVVYRSASVHKKLNAGSLYIFPASKSYSISHTPPNCICCLWFHIDFLPTVVDELLEIPVEENSSLFHLLHAAMATIHRHLNSDPYSSALVNTLVCYLEQTHLNRYPKKLEEIIAYLHAHYVQNCSVAQLSQQFGYSTEHFIRLFRKEVHMTPYQYLTRCRLNASIELLRQGIPVSQVAAMAGFRDAKTFSHCFKLHYGYAPSQFKQNYLPMP